MSLIEEARGCNVQLAGLEHLEAMYVQLRVAQDAYIKYGVPQPSWMGSKVAEMSRMIDIKRHALNEGALALLEVQERALMPKSEKRRQIAEQANALRRKLGIEVLTTETPTKASPTLEPEPSGEPKEAA